MKDSELAQKNTFDLAELWQDCEALGVWSVKIWDGNIFNSGWDGTTPDRPSPQLGGCPRLKTPTQTAGGSRG